MCVVYQTPLYSIIFFINAPDVDFLTVPFLTISICRFPYFNFMSPPSHSQRNDKEDRMTHLTWFVLINFVLTPTDLRYMYFGISIAKIHYMLK